MRYWILIVVFIALAACEKDDLENGNQSNISQIDYLVLSPSFFERNDTIGNIRYDSKGRLVQLDNEYYDYNENDDVSRITFELDDLPGLLDNYYFDLEYDVRGRLKSHSDMKFERPTSDVISIPYVMPRSYFYDYEGASPIPTVMEQPYYSPGLGDHNFGISGDVKQRSVFLKTGENVIARTTKFSGVKGGQWTPGPKEHFEIVTETEFKYDGESNVYQYLFGSLGFIPDKMLKFFPFEKFFIYTKNNVTTVSSGEESMSIAYVFDEKMRIKKITTGDGRSIEVVYK